jgi:gliding motility-associated-like protein
LANSNVTGLSPGLNVFRWTIPGGSCGSAFDQVSIQVDQNPTTALAGTAQQICAASTQLNANAAVIGSGQWTVNSGSGIFANSSDPLTLVSGLSSGTNIFTWTISNGVCPASSSQVTVLVDTPPTAPNAGADQIICSSATQLNAVAVNGASWSLISGSGTILNPSSAASTVSGLSPGITVLRWTSPGGTCNDTFDEVSITVQQLPTTSAAGDNQIICSTTTNLQGNAPAVGNGFWSLVSGSGVIENPTSPSSTVSGLSTGNNVFRWTISNGVCAPSVDEVTIQVQANPVTPNAGLDQTVCVSTAQLNASPTSNGQWLLVSGSGTFANASLATSSVSGLSVGVNVFRWTISGGSCGDVFDEVSITVLSLPTTAAAGPDQSICSTSSSLAGNTPVSGTGIWSVVSGSATFANAQSPTTSVTGLSIGTNILRWTISNGSCTPSSDEVSITVDNNPVAPNAGTDQSVCTNSVTMNATASTGGVWTLISGNGTITNPNSATTTITGLNTGVNIFRWTIPGGSCPSASDDVSITVLQAPSTAAAGQDQELCTTSAQLSANVPIIGNGLWTVVSGSGFFSNASQAGSAVSGMSAGQNVFRWSITNGTCPPSTDDVIITVLSSPAAAFAGADQNVCGSSTLLSATVPNSGSGLWTVTSGTGTFANSSAANSAVSGLSPGLNVFRWTVSNGSCNPVFDEVTIQSFVQPTSPNAGPDQSICALTAQLSASIPSVGLGSWSIISGAGIIVNAQQNQTTVNNLQTGVNTFRYSVSNGVCPVVSDDISIEVFVAPVSNAGSDQSVCGSSVSLSGNLPAGSTGIWTLVSGAGIIQSPNQAITQISNLAVGENVFRWSLNNGVCPVSFDDVIITRFLDPSQAEAGSDLQTCASSAQLNATIPAIGQGFWSVLSGSGNFGNPSSPASTVNQLAVGDNVLVWTVSNGNCPSTSDQVIITVDQNPTSAEAGPDEAICSNATVLAALVPQAGDGQWSVVSGTASITNINQANSTLTGIAAGSVTLRWTVTNGVCISFDEVVITRSLPPSASEAGEDQQICSETSQLQGVSPTSGNGLWSVVSGDATIVSPANPISAVENLSPGANVFKWTISSGACPAEEDQITIIRQEEPDQAQAGVDQSICSDVAILQANLPQVGTGLWSIVSGTGQIENAFAANTNVSGLSTGENVFQWTTLNGVCPASSDQVIITKAIEPDPAFAGEDALICGTSYVLQASEANVGIGEWLVIDGSAIFSDAFDAGTSIQNLEPGETRVSWNVSNSPCPASSDTIVLSVAALPDAAFAGVDLLVCDDSVFVAGNAPAVGSPIWSISNGFGLFEDSLSAFTAVTDLAEGTNTLVYTIINEHCSSVDSMQVFRFSDVSFVNAGNDTIVCSSEITLQADTPAAGDGLWQIISGLGSLSDPTNPQSTLELISDTLSLSWTVTNGVCASKSDTVEVFRQTQTAFANAMADQAICSSQLILQADTVSGATGFWDLLSGEASFGDSTQANTTLFIEGNGNILIRWNILSGACQSSDSVNISSAEPPFPVYAGENQTICETTTTLQASVPVVGTGTWLSLASGFFSNANSPNTTFLATSTGYKGLIWSVSNGACILRDTVFIDMLDIPSSDGGPDLESCFGDSVFLQAEMPSFGEPQWLFVSNNAYVANPSFENSAFIAEKPGVYYLTWKVTNDICSDSSLVTVTIYDEGSLECGGASNFVFIPEGFSPNADGVFDKFIIEHNPDKQVSFSVFDRRGVLVYENENYLNDWEGEVNTGAPLYGDNLPDGTYFYLIKVDGDIEFRKGYFTLWR